MSTIIANTRSSDDRDVLEYGLIGDFYIEVFCMVNTITKVATGLRYQCKQNAHTKIIFDSAKERGLRDGGKRFVLALKDSYRNRHSMDEVHITTEHFEEITGQKALTDTEYFVLWHSVEPIESCRINLIEF